MLKKKTYRADDMRRITVTDDAFPGFAATVVGFVGRRRDWRVYGDRHDVGDRITCTNGDSPLFTKTDALRMAELFVTRGREFL